MLIGGPFSMGVMVILLYTKYTYEGGGGPSEGDGMIHTHIGFSKHLHCYEIGFLYRLKKLN